MRSDTGRNERRALLGGLDRRSCVWRDAIGTGFATGASPRVLDLVSSRAGQGYCDN